MRIELPHVGESVTEGIIGKWLKRPGDRVQKYEPLVEVVTDKVTMEVPSPVDGVLREILVPEGTTVPMGAAIAEVDTEEGAALVGSLPRGEASSGTVGVLVEEKGAVVGPTGARIIEEAPPQQAPEERVRYSPVVRRLAQEHHVDLAQVKGTGAEGRVTKEDILRYLEEAKEAPAASAAAPPAVAAPATAAGLAAEEEAVALTPVRRLIAQHMARSASQIPHAWTMVEVDVTNLVSKREPMKEEFLRREGAPLTYLPFVVKAVVESLKENVRLNASWADDKIMLKRRIHIGVAVAASYGLVVPVVHDADRLSVAGLAKAIDELVKRARENKLTLEDVQGGTFTINNTGALGSVVSYPIINHPQAAVLTTEAIVKRPLVISDAIAIRSMMNLCLAFDHRVIDGAEAGVFL
ncbi:MAG: 2-oxo acid dehydrogenase subunit E2, partial [Chloroflexi bacterium]|nr:2-oxo acid dehydrogenase subunit E2 [Chloroflexota bacterium]